MNENTRAVLVLLITSATTIAVAWINARRDQWRHHTEKE